MVKKFFAALSLLFMFTSCAYAMGSAAYVSSSGAVNLISYDGSGGFTESEVISDSSKSAIIPFNHKGQARLLRASSSGIEIYDVTNGCKLISSNSSLSLSLRYGSVAEYGDNILLAGHGRGGFIIELNPSTCEIVNEYNYVDSSNAHYDEYWSGVLVANGTIYAGFEDEQANEESSTDNSTLVTMDKLGNITGSREFHNDWAVALSKGVIYVAVEDDETYASYSAGLYRLEKNLTMSLILEGADEIKEMTPDGRGGLYASFAGQEIYHWDGTSPKLIYNTSSLELPDDLKDYLCEIYYDVNNSILYAGFKDYLTEERHWYALKSDGSGLITSDTIVAGEGNRFAVIGNPSEATSSSLPSSLPIALIEPVTLTDDVIAKLAALVSIDKSQLKFITAANISAPQEPTQKMIDYMKNDGYEPAYKLNVLTVDENGYYVYLVNIPEEFVGKSVNDIKIYALGQKDFSSSSIKDSFWSLINGLLNYGELTSLTGKKINSLPAKVLAIGMLQAGQPFSVFLAKLLVSILTGASGGCVTGIGLFASMSAIAIFIRLRRK